MSRRHTIGLRVGVSALLLAPLVIATPVFAAPAVSATAGSAPLSVAANEGDASDPVARFGACMIDGGQGDLLMLIDESESLKTTDPDAARVRAVQYFLNQLGSFVSTSGVTLNVRFAAFGDAYTPLSPWLTVGPSTLPDLQSVAAGLSERDNGFDTDYWTALENSRRELAEQKAARGASAPSCQAIAWFTDGLLDFGIRTTSGQRDKFGLTKPYAPGIEITSEAAAVQVVAVARDLICTPGGLTDQLRSSDVGMFAVGLQPGNLDFSLVQAIATGPGCGSIVDPVPGIFTTASDIDGLLFAFDALGQPGQTAIRTEAGICQVSTCAEETHRFVLDPSTPQVHVLASAEVGGLDISLISPSGEVIALQPKTVNETSSVTGAAATASYAWQSDKTVSIDLSEMDPAAWTGLWQLAFVDPAGASAGKKSFSNIRISSDYKPAIVSKSDEWFVDDSFELELGIVDAAGNPVAVDALLGDLSLDAVLVDARGKRTVLATGLDKTRIGEPIDVSLAKTPLGDAKLELELVHTTAAVTDASGAVIEPGTALQPQRAEITIPVLPPLNFPNITGSLDLGALEGDTTVTTTLAFEGKGCVWLDSDSAAIVAAPAEAGSVTLTSKASSAATCLSGGSLPVTFAVGSSANGSVNGTVNVMLSPTGETDRAIPATVEFTADLRKRVNVTNFTVSLIGALVLGVGIPLGLVYLLKLLTARIPSRALSSQRIRISVNDGRVTRDGSTFALLPTDLRDLTGIPSGGARTLTVAGVTLSSRIGLWPASPGFVVVDAPGFVSASDGSPAWVSKVPRARLPLAVHNHWVVLRSPGAPASEAEVILFVSGDADADRKATIVDDLNARLPDVLARLVEVAGDAPAETPDDPWGASTSTTGAGFDFDGGTAPSGSSNSGFGFADD